jgi:hypothetical protein
MAPVQRICIPCVDNIVDVQFISRTFSKLQIAEVSKTLIKPGQNKLSIIIDIKRWYDTEVAYNFIQRLRDESKEARIVYKDEKWWPVYALE